MVVLHEIAFEVVIHSGNKNSFRRGNELAHGNSEAFTAYRNEKAFWTKFVFFYLLALKLKWKAVSVYKQAVWALHTHRIVE